MTEELSLRPPSEADVPALFQAIRESMPELRRWMTWCHEGYGEADARAWALSREAAFLARQELEFLVLDHGGEILGVCGVNAVRFDEGWANLGYWVRSSAAGRGIATAAARRVIDFAFRETSLQRLEIVCATGNLRSQRVAEKVGGVRERTDRDRFNLQGQMHDAVIFSILRSGWQAASAPPLQSGVLTSPAEPMLSRAIAETLAAPPSERHRLFAQLIGEIVRFMAAHPEERPWTCTVYEGTDGSAIFRGGVGHSLVVDPAGRLWRARSYEDFDTRYRFGPGTCEIDTLTPLYRQMREYLPRES